MTQQTQQHQKELNQILLAANQFKPEGAIIAGGALTSAFTGQPIHDVDYYFKSRKDFINAVFHAYDDMLWCVSATDRAITFVQGSDVIQLMLFDFFPTAEDVFDAFDFTINMAAYDLDSKQFIFHDDFLKHAAQRKLSFHSGTRYPYGSLLRTHKYQERGYTIDKRDLLRIGLACQKVKLESWEDLAAAIGGQYGERANINVAVPFSIDAAMDLYKDAEIVVADGGKNMPSNAEDLLVSVGFTLEELDEAQPSVEKEVWNFL